MMASVQVGAMRSDIARKFKSNSLYLRSDASKMIQKTLIDEKLDGGQCSGPQTQQRLDEILSAVAEQTLDSNFVEAKHIVAAFEKLNNARNAADTVTTSNIVQVLSAYDIPRLRYSYDRRQFILSRDPPRLHSLNAAAKAMVFKERFEILRQRTLRHRVFAKSIEGVSSAPGCQLSPLSSLLGRSGSSKGSPVIVLGMIAQLEEGKYFLEDADASVRIILSGNVEYSMGLFTENTIVLAEGVYVDETFHASSIGFPPPEPHSESISTFGSLNYFGGTVVSSEQASMKAIEIESEGAMLVVCSDVWLDKSQVREKLRQLFAGFASMSPAPVFVLMGNFLSQSYGSANARVLKDSLDLLADMIAEHEEISRSAHFVFVPGPKDIGGGIGNILPRRPLPKSCTTRLKSKVSNVSFATNPCRMRYCTQEITLFREDILSKMRRNCIIPPKLSGEGDEISMHLLKTLIDQAHLSPLPLHVSPLYWEYDQAMRLYPVPDVLILADKFDSYRHVYNGALAFNPGSFATSDFSFVVYTPSQLRANQESSVYDDWENLEGIVQYSKIQ